MKKLCAKKDRGEKKTMKDNYKNRKIFKEFLYKSLFLEEIEFLGLCKLLGVRLYDEDNKTARDFTLVYEEMIDKFLKLDPKVAKEIMNIVNAAVKKEDDK